MRRPFIVGNWKMNHTLAPARALVAQIREGLPADCRASVGIAPTSVLLMPMCKEVADCPIELGAQNVFHESSGAYTGEVAPAMLLDAGCTFAIIGHSERRRIFGESNELLHNKVLAATQAGLNVIFCIGETLEQRESGQTNKVLEHQLRTGLDQELDWRKVTLAYEPVWAIGTGQNATPDQAQEAHQFIRGWLNEQFGDQAANAMRIQYGGSVKKSNAEALLKLPDVDGALVGGASLDAQEFLGIIQAAHQNQN